MVSHKSLKTPPHFFIVCWKMGNMRRNCSIVCFSIQICFYCAGSVFRGHCHAGKQSCCQSNTLQMLLHEGSKSDGSYLCSINFDKIPNATIKAPP